MKLQNAKAPNMKFSFGKSETVSTDATGAIEVSDDLIAQSLLASGFTVVGEAQALAATTEKKVARVTRRKRSVEAVEATI